jgi:hypothetical protein
MFGQIQGDFTEIVGNGAAVTAVNTDFIPYFDCSAFAGFMLSIDGTFNLTLQAQFTNDINQAPLAANCFNIARNVSTAGIGVSGGRYFIPKGGRFLRIRASAFASNTSLVGVLEAYTVFTSPPGSSVPISQPLGFGLGSGLTPTVAAQNNANGTATAATATATLANVALRFGYLTAMEVTIISTATAGSAELSLTGLAGGTLVYEIEAPGVASTVVSYAWSWGYPGLQASAISTDIVATLPTLGAGTGKVSIVLHGYTL